MICNAFWPRSVCPRAKHKMGPSLRCAGLLLAVGLVGACDRAQTPSRRDSQIKIWEEFSGEKALAHVQPQVDFGPRPPGTEAIEKCRTYLTQQLELSGWKVTRQTFAGTPPRGRVDFVCLTARFPA